MKNQSELNIAAANIEKGNGRISYDGWTLNKYGISWDDYEFAIVFNSLDTVKKIHDYILTDYHVSVSGENDAWACRLTSNTSESIGLAANPAHAWMAAILRALTQQLKETK